MVTKETDVFRALADPTRRSILELLRDGERSVQEIAERYPVSRPAISKHLRILRDALLVDEQRQGRQRLYRLAARPLDAARGWLALFAEATPAPAAARRTPAARSARPPARAPRRRPRRQPAPEPGDDWRVW